MSSNKSLNKSGRRRWIALLLAMCMALAGLTGCGGSGGGSESDTDADSAAAQGPEIAGLTYESTLDLQRATEYSVYRYEGGYDLVDIHDHQRFLLVPEDGTVPEGLDADIIVLQKPIDRIYLAATATMAMFYSMGAQDNIRMSSIKEDAWTFDEPKEDMKAGKIIYAGKYSAPDYETMLDEECDLAIESTMILHNPEVKEKLTEIGIKTVVERSSYEDHPLGRTEWIKVYGAILGLEEQADAVFSEQMEKVKALESLASTGKTVAFFYVNTAGNVVTYKSEGYLPSMIKIAGGEYIFSDLSAEDDTGKLSTVNMSMEQFYHSAVNADYIIYNCSIAAQLHTIEDLTSLSPVLADFKAVKEGNAWCTTESMYQQTDKMGTIIEEMNKIFSDRTDGTDLSYIFRLE